MRNCQRSLSHGDPWGLRGRKARHFLVVCENDKILIVKDIHFTEVSSHWVQQLRLRMLALDDGLMALVQGEEC